MLVAGGVQKIERQFVNETGTAHAPTRRRLDIQFWYRRVYAQCHSILLSSADAEDAAQETFVRALACVDQLRSTIAMSAWIRHIARNVCIDMIRRKKVRRASSTNVHSIAGPADAAALAQRDQCEHVMRLVHALPDPLREIILLHYYEEMTYDQMAEWLDIARSTVNDRLSKARELLKQQMVTENVL
jgi:RNA polymerase sigma-70 factor, ECF subfamily